MKSLKRTVALLGLFALFCLAGAQVVAATEINYWSFTDDVALGPYKAVAKDYEAKSGNTTKWTAKGYDATFETLLTAVAAGNGPDVAFVNSLWAVDLFVRGATVDLKAAHPADMATLLPQLWPGMMKQYITGNSVIALGQNGWTQVIWYRDDIFKQNGWAVPTTWDELYALIPLAKARGKIISWFPDSLANSTNTEGGILAAFFPFLWQHGGDLYDKTLTKSTLDTPQALAAWKEFLELYTKYQLPQAVDARKTITSDELVYAGCPHWQPGFWDQMLKEEGQTGKSAKIAEIPGVKLANGTVNRTGFFSSWSMILFKTKNQNVAWDWVKSQYTADAVRKQIAYYYAAEAPHLWVFSNMAGTTAELNARQPADRVKVVLDAMGKAQGNAPAIGGVLVYRHIANAFFEVLNKIKTPEESLQDANNLINIDLKSKQDEFMKYQR